MGLANSPPVSWNLAQKTHYFQVTFAAYANDPVVAASSGAYVTGVSFVGAYGFFVCSDVLLD